MDLFLAALVQRGDLKLGGSCVRVVCSSCVVQSDTVVACSNGRFALTAVDVQAVVVAARQPCSCTVADGLLFLLLYCLGCFGLFGACPGPGLDCADRGCRSGQFFLTRFLVGMCVCLMLSFAAVSP